MRLQKVLTNRGQLRKPRAAADNLAPDGADGAGLVAALEDGAGARPRAVDPEADVHNADTDDEDGGPAAEATDEEEEEEAVGGFDDDEEEENPPPRRQPPPPPPPGGDGGGEAVHGEEEEEEDEEEDPGGRPNAAAVRHRAPLGDAEVVVRFKFGEISFHPQANVFVAVCWHPAHDHHKYPCVRTRTAEGSDAKAACGRCLGHLMVWLAKAPTFATRTLHVDCRKLDLKLRMAARALYKRKEQLQGGGPMRLLRSRERRQRTGEPEEPNLDP